MTVTNTDLKSGPYITNGTTTVFSITYYYLQDIDNVVQLTNLLTGAITPLVQNSDYIVTDLPALSDGIIPGGSITVQPYAASSLANSLGAFPSGYTLTITRSLGLTQGESYPESGVFPSAATELALDKLTLLDQQQQNQINNCLQFPSTDTGITTTLPAAAARANLYLGFDGSGNPAAVAGTNVSGSPTIHGSITAGHLTTWYNSTTIQDGGAFPPGSTPAGSDTQVQFNDASSFGGSSKLVFNKTTGALGLTGPLTITGTLTTSGVNTLSNLSTGIVHANSSGALTSSNVSLATEVTGNLPVANLNSGTNADSSHFWRGDGTWATLAPTSAQGASMVLLGTLTASGSASISFTSIPSGYDHYVLKFSNVIPVTNGAVVDAVLSTNNGSSYVAANYVWATWTTTSTGASGAHGSNSDSQFILTQSGVNNAATVGASGEVNFIGLSSSNQTFYSFHSVYYSGDTNTYQETGGGRQGGTGGPFNALKILMSTGNIASGTFSLYAIRTS